MLTRLSLPLPSAIDREIEKRALQRSHLEFTRKFFQEAQGQQFSVGRHHTIMCDTLDRVYTGEISRLIINVPPGYSKTELAVINFVARGLAISPKSRYIHASYAQPLALDNSSKIRDIIALPSYQDFWPLTMKADTSAKGLWRTDEGGGLRAASSGEPITGFRAGRMLDDGEPWRFTGALIIDDPIKPDDVASKIEREFINQRWQNTFQSRLADQTVPVIVIMQRLHIDDFVAHVLKTSGEYWHVLKLPVLIDGECEPIHEKAIMIPHGLPDGPLWEKKHTVDQINILKLSKHEYHGQYAQDPIASGGNVFQEDWFGSYDDLPKLSWRAIWVDTAQKTAERNDYSVFQHWGKTMDGRAVLIDQARGRFEAPELESTALSFWAKAKAMDPGQFGHCRKMVIEDKSSGTGLIQGVKRKAVPVIALQRDRDKYTRGLDIVPAVASGMVLIPRRAKFIDDWMSEILTFPDGLHDDQVDPFIDAVVEMCGGGAYSLVNVG